MLFNRLLLCSQDCAGECSAERWRDNVPQGFAPIPGNQVRLCCQKGAGKIAGIGLFWWWLCGISGPPKNLKYPTIQMASNISAYLEHLLLQWLNGIPSFLPQDIHSAGNWEGSSSLFPQIRKPPPIPAKRRHHQIQWYLCHCHHLSSHCNCAGFARMWLFWGSSARAVFLCSRDILLL